MVYVCISMWPERFDTLDTSCSDFDVVASITVICMHFNVPERFNTWDTRCNQFDEIYISRYSRQYFCAFFMIRTSADTCDLKYRAATNTPVVCQLYMWQIKRRNNKKTKDIKLRCPRLEFWFIVFKALKCHIWRSVPVSECVLSGCVSFQKHYNFHVAWLYVIKHTNNNE